MRIPFWRSGKAAPVEKAKASAAAAAPAASRPAPAYKAAAPASDFGDLDLRAIGLALNRKRSWIIIPTLLALLLSLAAVNLVPVTLAAGTDELTARQP